MNLLWRSWWRETCESGRQMRAGRCHVGLTAELCLIVCTMWLCFCYCVCGRGTPRTLHEKTTWLRVRRKEKEDLQQCAYNKSLVAEGPCFLFLPFSRKKQPHTILLLQSLLSHTRTWRRSGHYSKMYWEAYTTQCISSLARNQVCWAYRLTMYCCCFIASSDLFDTSRTRSSPRRFVWFQFLCFLVPAPPSFSLFATKRQGKRPSRSSGWLRNYLQECGGSLKRCGSIGTAKYNILIHYYGERKIMQVGMQFTSTCLRTQLSVEGCINQLWIRRRLYHNLILQNRW